MTQQLEIVTRSVGQLALVMLAGELDVSTATDLRDELAKIDTESRGTLAVDLAEVSSIDSAGVRVLHATLEDAHANDYYFLLLYPSRQVQRVLDVSGLTKEFSIVGSDHDTDYVGNGRPSAFPHDPMTAVARSGSIQGNQAALAESFHQRRREGIT